jgi:hypothetical protein
MRWIGYCERKGTVAGRQVRFLSGAPSFGLKVFMDARSTVTAKEGDRYPLGPPRILLVTGSSTSSDVNIRGKSRGFDW